MICPTVITAAYWRVKTVAVRVVSSVKSLVKLSNPVNSKPRIGLPW